MEQSKFEKLYTEVVASLNDEQKAKAAGCKTVEDLITLAGEEGIELPDEALNSVTGGCGAASIGSTGSEVPASQPAPKAQSTGSLDTNPLVIPTGKL